MRLEPIIKIISFIAVGLITNSTVYVAGGVDYSGNTIHQEYWILEGFEENENVFMKEPDRNKKM